MRKTHDFGIDIRDCVVKFADLADQVTGKRRHIVLSRVKRFLVSLKPLAVVVFVEFFEKIKCFFFQHGQTYYHGVI